jgi:hypothetical protein
MRERNASIALIMCRAPAVRVGDRNNGGSGTLQVEDWPRAYIHM